MMLTYLFLFKKQYLINKKILSVKIGFLVLVLYINKSYKIKIISMKKLMRILKVALKVLDIKSLFYESL